tara:strand:+ start:7696 stop:7836 length:141 start_codon:yes stop_codon:yes gene_type:complete
MAKKAKVKKTVKVPPQKKGERDTIQLKIKDTKKEDVKPKDIFEGYK